MALFRPPHSVWLFSSTSTSCASAKKVLFSIAGTPVSMNLWAFRPGIVPAFESGFEAFLRDTVPGNPMKAEYYLPYVPKVMIAGGRAGQRKLLHAMAAEGVLFAVLLLCAFGCGKTPTLPSLLIDLAVLLFGAFAGTLRREKGRVKRRVKR